MLWISILLAAGIIVFCLVPELAKKASATNIRIGLLAVIVIISILYIVPSGHFASLWVNLKEEFKAEGIPCDYCGKYIARYIIGILLQFSSSAVFIFYVIAQSKENPYATYATI